MRRTLFILLALVSMFLVASCGPPEGYDVAKQNAIDAQAAAKANEADEYCATEWAAAEQTMKQALEADAAEEWDIAMPLFEQAKNLYDVAKMCAIKAKDAAKAPPPPPPPAPPKPVVKPKTYTTYFDYDKYGIRKDQILGLKDEAGKLKGKFSAWSFQLTGWCDIRGTEEYNLALGERRAATVYNFLVASGVAPARLTKKSGGETTKFSAALTEKGFQLNRRVEISAMTK
ncbi:MAG: OmpA family protein [Candidatus Lernaella stagnicola]|nr:OmpA family protein [Candidatus Lernaella stagnicola]